MEVRYECRVESRDLEQVWEPGARCPELNIRESRLSYIIHGHVEPAATELNALRRELGNEIVDRAFRRDVEETKPAA